MLDFLKEIVSSVADPSAGGTIDLEAEKAEGKRRRGTNAARERERAGEDGEGDGTTAPPKRRRRKAAANPEADDDYDAEMAADDGEPKKKRRGGGRKKKTAAAPAAAAAPSTSAAAPGPHSDGEDDNYDGDHKPHAYSSAGAGASSSARGGWARQDSGARYGHQDDEGEGKDVDEDMGGSDGEWGD